MRYRLLLLSVIVAALALPGGAQAAGGCGNAQVVPDDDNGAVVRNATLCLVNDERVDRGLNRLRSVPALQDVAGDYAERMVRERFFDHSSPDGGTFLERIRSTSYLGGDLRRWTVGENIAWGTGSRATPARIVSAWMDSPGHRRNILNARFTEFGLGIAIGAPQRGEMRRPAATYVNEFGARHR